MRLETSRLWLEPWDERGLELVTRLAALPEIVRYIGDGSTFSPDAAATLAQRQAAHWSEHGWGSYVAVERSTGDTVALISQNVVADATPGLEPWEHEIGWWVDPSAWGRGFAREGGAALVRNAFEVIGSPSVVARIQPGNAPSFRVARALGLRFEFASTGRAGEVVHVLRLDAPADRGSGHPVGTPAPPG